MKKVIMTLILIMGASIFVGCDTEKTTNVTNNTGETKVEEKKEETKKEEEIEKEEEKNKIYTADNDEKVKEFLFGNPDLKDFYSNYYDKKIGFTAIVSNVRLVEGKKTRYEAVLQVVDETGNISGPFIKVKDFAFAGDDISSELLNPDNKQFDVVVNPRSYTPSDDIFFVDLKEAHIK